MITDADHRHILRHMGAGSLDGVQCAESQCVGHGKKPVALRLRAQVRTRGRSLRWRA